MLGDSCSYKSGGPRKSSLKRHFSSKEEVSLLLFSCSVCLTLVYSPSAQLQGNLPKSPAHVPSLNDTLRWFLIALRINAPLLPSYKKRPDLRPASTPASSLEALLLPLQCPDRARVQMETHIPYV